MCEKERLSIIEASRGQTRWGEGDSGGGEENDNSLVVEQSAEAAK